MSRRLALIVPLVVTLSACGGNSKAADEDPTTAAPTTAAPSASASPSPSSTMTSEDDLKVAVKAYSKTFLTGDGAAAYALLSKRCQASMPLSEFAAITEQAETTYGDVKISSLDVKVNGTKATATYTFPVPAINQTNEPWVEEDGWKNNDC